MTKIEFMTQLSHELHKRKLPDAVEIVEEYEQHFAFKLADGYSEAEIAAKLGSPVQLAAQFDAVPDAKVRAGRRVPVAMGLGVADLFAGIFFVFLIGWALVMAAFCIACGAVSVCLFGGPNPFGILPPIPYWCGVVYAICLAALCVLAACGCVYFAAFVRQLFRSFGRFQHNAWAAAGGGAVLPEVPIAPLLAPKVKRRIRTVALVSLALFAACFVLGWIVSALSAGAIEFWHAWGWFGYGT